jgi:multicomponent Na+:H+ antiporter subunit E
MVLNNSFTWGAFVFAIILAGVLIAFITRVIHPGLAINIRASKILPFFFMFAYEIIISNIKVIYEILTPKEHMYPGIIQIALNCRTDQQRVWLSNVLSLTPGTIVVTMSPDKTYLFLHIMFLQHREALVKDIRKIEQHIIELIP